MLLKNRSQFIRITLLIAFIFISLLLLGLDASAAEGPSNALKNLSNPNNGIVPLTPIPVVEIGAGLQHTCALLNDGRVKCWGDNQVGQIGDGTTTERFSPVFVYELTGVADLAVGLWHTCVLMNTGGVKCWGENIYGELGDGTNDKRYTPTDVSGLSSGVTAVYAGGFHTCAVLATGGIKCWGMNSKGHLGDGTTDNSNVPVDVSGLTANATAVAAGRNHTCALLVGGGVKCWGFNNYGQIGDDTYDDRHLPVDVLGLTSGVSGIAVGDDHSCALLDTTGLKCWGYNSSGQVGSGSTDWRHLAPVDVFGLSSGVIMVDGGKNHTCALTNTGAMKCWGNNESGQLGDGTQTYRRTPVDVSGLSGGVTRITAGRYHTCALLNNGSMYCFGGNYAGQIGNGEHSHLIAPTFAFVDWLNSFMGSVEITSDQPIVAIGRPHYAVQVMAYNGANAGANTVYLPMLFNNMWGYTSTFTVQNTGGGTATYDITFKDALNGSTSCEISGEVLPEHGVVTYDVTNLPTCTTGALPDPWYGGGTIVSDQPLVAVAKPNINGSDAVGYNGFTSGAATAYLPMLFRGKWGYQSAFYVQNLDPAQNANLTIDFYDADGNFTCTYVDSNPIGPSVTRGYWMADINKTVTECTGGTGFPSGGWAGSAVVTSTAGSSEIVAIGRPHLDAGEVAAYNGFTSGGTTNYLPMLFRGIWDYDAAFYIQNVSGSDTTIEIVFYDIDGNEVCIYTDPAQLGQNATRGYWTPALHCNDGRDFDPAGWAGSAKITTSQNVIAVGRPHLYLEEVVVYNAFTGGANAVFVPILFRSYADNQSALYIQNLGPVDANITISFYAEDDGYQCSSVLQAPPGVSGSIWMGLVDGTLCVP